jgi:hypothetical protein
LGERFGVHARERAVRWHLRALGIPRAVRWASSVSSKDFQARVVGGDAEGRFGQVSPRSVAHAETCERDLKPSLLSTCFTCTSAVASVITSVSAISRLLRPDPSSAATCSSRLVSPCSPRPSIVTDRALARARVPCALLRPQLWQAAVFRAPPRVLADSEQPSIPQGSGVPGPAPAGRGSAHRRELPFRKRRVSAALHRPSPSVSQ